MSNGLTLTTTRTADVDAGSEAGVIGAVTWLVCTLGVFDAGASAGGSAGADMEGATGWESSWACTWRPRYCSTFVSSHARTYRR